MMVDRLDQVLITLVSFVLRASVTLLITWESTKGPFLIERAINLSSSDLNDGRSSRPGFDHPCFFRPSGLCHLIDYMGINKRSLFDRAGHQSLLFRSE